MDFLAWNDTLEKLSAQIGEALPAIFFSTTLLLVGFAAAHFSRIIAKRVLRRLASRLETWVGASASRLSESGFWRAGPSVLGEGVFWVIFLFFSAAALEKLPVPIIAESVQQAAYYLPRALVAVIIVFLGVGAGTLAHLQVSVLLQPAGIERSAILGRLAQGCIVVVALIVAAHQVGLDSGLFAMLGAVAVGTILGGMALAFGLGSGPVVTNIMASYYASKALGVGTVARVGDTTGIVREITATSIVLEAGGDRIHVPARKYCDEVCVVVGDSQ